ncbi:DUF6049 family protein [Herbiconiux sp. CPCC 205716]|uniref:DUF6049 family protein n=1 Tax=Herbiconiux gentiana TaxID=2970912 RepID=A0ABT2GI72_9MICO|nr:DUF6049 family protein [Herbiconiux gentiana]MCS5715868.1 DUF6049 family protein [Herbiconiux gentiana]
MTSPARRLNRVAPAIAACALIAGAVFATPFGAAATTPDPSPSASAVPVPTTATDASSPVSLALAAGGNGVIAPGADLTVTVEVTGASAGGTVSLSIDDSALRTSSSLSSWLDGGEGGSLVALVTVPAPTGAGTVTLTVPAAQLPAGLGGAHGLEATLTTDGSDPVSTRSTVVVDDGITSRADVTVIAPITSVASSTGLIQPAALEAFTNDTGVLTRELDAVVGRPVTIAVDPRIIVSIRALGSTAPDSAVAWLQRLESASNPVIPLSYGDSDLSGERQAGASSALQPTSFDYALDPADFTDVDPLIEPTATPTTTAPATTSPTPAAPTVPTLEQLTDWDYASTTIAWPRAGSVTAADLPFFAASGYSASIVDSQQLTPASGDAGEAVQAVATTGEHTVLAADHAVSEAIQDAVAATTDTARGQAVGELAASLALAAETGGGTAESPTPVLAVLDRAAMNLNSIDQVVSTVQALPWSAPGSLDDLLQRTPTQTVSLVDGPQSDERVTRIANLLLGGQQIDAYSSVLSNPQLLSGRHRADLLALLSNSWVANEGGWSVATDSFNEETATTLRGVQIVEGSDINLLSSSAPLPLTISNELPYAVSVIVHVTASNGRLLIDQNDVGVVVEANSRKSAQIPVTAVANGSVTLSFQLTSSSGVLIANPSPVAVNVSADWETWGTVIFVVALVLLFGGGLARNILRRRKERRAPSVEDAS